jgi:CRISPR-associated protein Csb2
MLAFELELLTGRYSATRYNDRSRAEWPPHPARFFSALVATHYAHDPVFAEERRALEWLEQQPPPVIAASLPEDVAEREAFTVFVPVNDPTVVGSFEDEVEKLEAARRTASESISQGDGPPKRGSPAAKAMAQVEKLEKALVDRMARALQPGKVTDAALKDAESLVPETRKRQARTFPSVCPRDPRFHFVWPDADPSADVRAALLGLAERLVRLGHSSSLIRATLTDAPPPAAWRPDDTGEHQLRVVRAGQLQALDEAFQLHLETQPRVLPASFQAYTTRAERTETTIPGSHFGEDWLIFRRVRGPSLPMMAGPGLASVIRRALLKFAGAAAPEILTGHAAGGGPSQRPHLAIVPLPFVGHLHADGAILGVALVLPGDASAEDRRAAFRAVRAWELEGRKEVREEGQVPVFLGASGTMVLERLDGPAGQASLQPRTWCEPARRWLTATPIALDRNPGELWSRKPEEAAGAEAEAITSIRAAVQFLGLPVPSSVTPLRFAPLAGTTKARRFPRFPQDPRKPQRVLVHAEVQFETPVRGPILLGAGRYFGLGLLRPVNEHG